MGVQGTDVLEVVVRKNMVATSAIAKELTGISDGRKVRARLTKLERAGLLEVIDGVAIPTGRGREVDATLARIAAARGGTFLPWKDTDMTTTEKLALR
jgi:hypothetical protein